MKKSILALLLSFVIICGSSNMYAQKYGHVNLGNLLTQLPEIETSSENLEIYQKQLADELQQRINVWEKKVQDLQNGIQDLPPKEVKEKETILLKEQEEIYAEEQTRNQLVLDRRNEIMAPIIAKAQAAIIELGKEKGYTMIFDTSIPNVLLFVKDADDLTTEVLAKLGVKQE